MQPSLIISAILVPLIMWRVYRKFRKNIGPQKLSAGRTWLKLGFFLLVLGAVVGKTPFATLGMGLVGGILVAAMAGRFTRFERTEAGLYYTPNTYLGVGVASLLVGCMVYRFLASRTGNAPSGTLTSVASGLALGYYLSYAAFLLIKRHGMREA